MAQKGKDVLIKISDGSSGYNAVAGIRSGRISLNNGMIDVTNADSTNRWRELLDGVSVKSMSVSGSGVLSTTGSSADDLRAVAVGGNLESFELVVPGLGTFDGDFLVTSLEYAGEHDGEATYELSLESSGEISWTAEGA